MIRDLVIAVICIIALAPWWLPSIYSEPPEACPRVVMRPQCTYVEAQNRFDCILHQIEGGGP
jgi:hypothetical protein